MAKAPALQAPPSTLPMFNPATGLISPAWYLFFQQLTELPHVIDEQAVGASPFSFTASYTGDLIIKGGTITGITLTRGRVVVTFTGAVVIPVSQGDVVDIAFSVAPSNVWFVPLAVNL